MFPFPVDEKNFKEVKELGSSCVGPFNLTCDSPHFFLNNKSLVADQLFNEPDYGRLNLADLIEFVNDSYVCFENITRDIVLVEVCTMSCCSGDQTGCHHVQLFQRAVINVEKSKLPVHVYI